MGVMHSLFLRGNELGGGGGGVVTWHSAATIAHMLFCLFYLKRFQMHYIMISILTFIDYVDQ